MGRISPGAIFRIFLIVSLLGGAVGLQSAGKYPFTKRDKAFYADPSVVDLCVQGWCSAFLARLSEPMERSRPEFW